MPRNRMIKPEFWDDEKLAGACRFEARLTYIGLWTHADDYGVVKGHVIWLKTHIFPYDDIPVDEFRGWLGQIEDFGRIVPFEANGEKYYYIPTFMKHQKINRPSSDKRNPAPPAALLAKEEGIGGPAGQDRSSDSGSTTGEERLRKERKDEARRHEEKAKTRAGNGAHEERPKGSSLLPFNRGVEKGISKSRAVREIRELRKTMAGPDRIESLMRRYGVTEAELGDGK